MPPPFILTWRRSVASEDGPAAITRHVLLTLSLYMDGEGECFPSVQKLSSATGLAERSVRTHLQLAESAGWIEREYRGKRQGQAWRQYEYRATMPKGAAPDTARRVKGAAGGAGRSAGKVRHMTTEGAAYDDSKVRQEVPLNSNRELSINSGERFEEAWKLFPRRPNNSKADARKQWNARVKAGADPAAMIEGTRRYAAYVTAEKIEPRYVKQASTFFGPGEHWTSDYSTTTNGTGRSAGERSLYLRPSDLPRP